MASDFSQIFKNLFFSVIFCVIIGVSVNFKKKKGLQQEGHLVVSLTLLPLKMPHINNINMNTNLTGMHQRQDGKHRSDLNRLFF